MNDSPDIGSLFVDKQMHGKFRRGSTAESDQGARSSDLDEIGLRDLSFVERCWCYEDISVCEPCADVAIGRGHKSPLIEAVACKNNVRSDFMAAKHDAVMITKNATMFNCTGVGLSPVQFLV